MRDKGGDCWELSHIEGDQEAEVRILAEEETHNVTTRFKSVRADVGEPKADSIVTCGYPRAGACGLVLGSILTNWYRSFGLSVGSVLEQRCRRQHTP